MTASMIPFFISAIAMAIMIKLKSPLSFMNNKTDNAVHSSYVYIRRLISYINRHSAIALIQWIAYHILSWIRSVYIWIRSIARSYPHSKKVLDMVRGKGTAEKNNGASFYLKKISEEKVH
ncbi:MAG TPA: hypothetical protein VI775_02235 [Candidatus Paceibacterota bacterium]